METNGYGPTAQPNHRRAARLLLGSWCALVLLCAIASPAWSQQTADAEVAQAGSQSDVEEIVVTARRREELLIDTPVSVTALSGADLNNAQTTRIDDIGTLVPNLGFQLTADGMAPNIRIRGIGTPQAVAIAFDPGVGVYVDGIYMARSIGTLLDVVDIQQLEVLRGPQGTLFGKNSVGGALTITTVKPRQEFEGSVLVRPGNRGQVFTQAMLNIPIDIGPLEDKLFSRFSFSSTNDDGYVRNLNNDDRYGDRAALTFLGSLRYLLTDDITLDVSGSWSRDHNRGRSGPCVFITETQLSGLVPGLEDACDATSPFAISAPRQVVDLESYGAWGTGTWEIGDLWLLDATEVRLRGSWREQIPRFIVDVDGTVANSVERNAYGGSPRSGEPGFQRQYQSELQFNASAWEDRISLVAGTFGYWEEATDNTVLMVAMDTLDNVTLNQRFIENWDWAIYGQSTIDFTEWLSLTGGIRFTQEKKGLGAKTIPLNNQDDTFGDPTLDAPIEKVKFSEWTPMASLALTLPEDWADQASLDHLMGYFTYARGFRGGGFNGVINPTLETLDQFQPEFYNSFEIGFKTRALDNRLGLNVALYYGDYSDIQVIAQEVTDMDNNMDGVNDVIQTTLNAAEATTMGAEIELNLRPIDGMVIIGSIGIQDTEFDDFGKGCIPGDDENNEQFQCAISDFDGQEIDRSGESFRNVPKFQSNLIVQYGIPLDLPDRWYGTLTPRIEWYYQSKVHIIGPEIEEAKQPGYNLLNARLGYRFLEGQAELALWARNLTDETYLTQASPVITSFGYLGQIYGSPRTYGGEISFRF